MSRQTRSRPLATVLFRREALFFMITLLCSLIIFMTFLRLISSTMWDRAAQGVRLEVERDADTKARLLVFEFSHLRDLETRTEPDSAIDERIKRLLWEKVTFNETIRGIELISRQADDSGRHLVYSYFPLSQQETDQDRGPQKTWRSLTGPEGDLIRILNREQRVDRNLLDAINQGRKLESEMVLRYFPQYIPLPDRGAIYWGVTKVGINIDALRRFLLLLEDEKARLRQTLLWIMGIVTAFSLTLGLSGLYWLSRKTTAPLEDYGRLATVLETGGGMDLPSLQSHLSQHDPQEIREFEQLQAFSRHLGDSIQTLAERLIRSEWEACGGRLTARMLATADRTALSAGLSGWSVLFAPRPEEWRLIELEPLLRDLDNVLTAALPAGALLVARQPLPPLYGCEARLVQALVLLADYALMTMPAGGRLSWRVHSPLEGTGLELEVYFPGPPFQPEDISRLMQPVQTGGAPPPPLGPFLAAGIARQHGGNLDVQADPGGGLHLRLTIPGAAAANPDEEARDHSPTER